MRPDPDARAETRAASREAVRQAREAVRDAREAARESVAAVREQLRQAREAERDRRGRRAEGDEGDTRTRIQRIAIALFTEQGYEATSLREIAERLGVTKAALYYHFKTKEEIIDSLVNERTERMAELIQWASGQPRTEGNRCELLRRYSDMLFEQDQLGLIRFFERNQTTMTQHKSGLVMREKLIQMLDLLTEADAPLTTRIRCSLAIFALHSTWFTVPDPNVTDEQRREASLEVALDLVKQN